MVDEVFEALEAVFASRGQSLADATSQQMDEVWEEVKSRESDP